MAGKHITPTQKTEALTLRSAGYTLTTISDMTGISVSTLKRLFSEHGVSKGRLKQDVIDKARDALLSDTNAIDTIKQEVATLTRDDIAQVKRLREAMAIATEQLTASDTAEALQVMRAVSAGAVALKSTSETLRKTLGMDKEGDFDVELPELTISIMTDSEIEAVKEQAKSRSFGLDDELGDTDEGIVEYEDDSQEVVSHAVS